MSAISFAGENARELERLRALVEGMSDDELRMPVNGGWTVTESLGHLIFWDAHALWLAQRLLRGGEISAADKEPEDVDWVNNAALPLIDAIPPRDIAALAVRIAQETDAAVASLNSDQLARTSPTDPNSGLYVERYHHRREHLDEIEAALAHR